MLRTDEPPAGLEPQPGVAELGALVERVRATGLPVDLAVEGTPFPLGAAAELTVYRIVQEALTNTIRHAAARRATVTIAYDRPRCRCGSPTTAPPHAAGRAPRRTASTGCASGPRCTAARCAPGRTRRPGGWLVEATLR